MSIDFTSLLEASDDIDAPETFQILQTTIGDTYKDIIATDETEVEINEDQIEVSYKSIY